MSGWISGMKRSLTVRSSESENRKSLRISLIEGIPANILANLLGGPLQTVFLTYLGFSAFHIGLVLAIPPFALLIQVLIAFVMQSWRNRRFFVALFGIVHRTMWVGTGLIPLTFSEDAWIPVYLAMWLVCMISGQAGGVVWTSLMADIVPASVRGKYFGIRNTVHWAVVCITLLLGGQIMEWLPGTQGFVVLFSISAVCIVWNGWALTRYPNPPFQPSESGKSLRMFSRPFTDRRFLTATLFIALFILLQNVAVPLFSYVMLEVMKLSASKVTLIIMLQNLVMMISYYYWGLLNSRYSTNALLLWTFPLIAGACAIWGIMAVLPALLILIVAHVLLGFGLAGYNLLVFNFLIGDSPKSERPMYVAVFSAFTGIAGFIGPIAGGWLYDQAAGGPMWVQSYGISMFAGAALLALSAAVAPLVFRNGSAPRRPPTDAAIRRNV
ncbi:MFS transporter [Cohnella sp. LGH]|uniref:Putative MFS family arabinose efflux permease n=1 Tax=Cohnella phaseoli TaxID=456490 RepID=A0A3D9IX84_9BACL|nr:MULTISPECIES: MFS transporter [Cohnella]QTH44375.1 MFS transporter [Cohnella sp. LGH]RED66418.1 putative MFS family arabinose efflux permease [Cohnella phaseoli]